MSAFRRPAQALCQFTKLLFRQTSDIDTLASADTVSVIERQLSLLVDVFQREESKTMEWLVGVIGHDGEDSKIRVTRVIDEAGWAWEEFTIDFVRVITEASVGAVCVAELVEGEEVDILVWHVGSGETTAVGFLGGDELSDVASNELATLDIFCWANTLEKLVCVLLGSFGKGVEQT